jgi:Big-like domain-containing protein
MTFARPLCPLLAVLAAGCIDVPDVEPSPREVNLVLQGERGEGTVFASDSVNVTVEFQAVVADSVELFIDGKSETRLESPYTYDWDSSAVPEGPHPLHLQALDRGELLVSPQRVVMVDRTPPQLVLRKPLPGSTYVRRDALVQAEFSEPIKASSVSEGTVLLFVAGTRQTARIELSSDGKVLTVSPLNGASSSGTASLYMRDVTDLAGNKPQESAWTWDYL